MSAFLLGLSCIGLLIFSLLRLYTILPGPSRPPPKSATTATRRLAVFLGSGGHTAEALSLVRTLDFTQYSTRTYIISEGDILSATKARELESTITPSNDEPPSFTILIIPRARRVHQALLTVPLSVLNSLFACLRLITLAQVGSQTPAFADVLLFNGPGTCVPLCLAVYLNKFLGLPRPRTVYVESFARVKKLSLSGKILRPLVDRFIVQWYELLADQGRGEYHGWLC